MTEYSVKFEQKPLEEVEADFVSFNGGVAAFYEEVDDGISYDENLVCAYNNWHKIVPE
jgi:hypothetical protein